MKIKINEFETYEINYSKNKEEMSVKDFLIFVERLENIKRIVARNQVFEEQERIIPSLKKKRYKVEGRKRVWCNTREKTVYVLSIFYQKSIEEKQSLADKIGFPKKEINKAFFGLKKRFNIKPFEVGLTRWPVKGDHSIDSLRKLRIPNFEIKEVDLLGGVEQVGATNTN